MTSNAISALPRQHALSARLMAFVLLILVSYSATAEVAHQHGKALSDRRTEVAAAFNSPDNTGSSSRSSRPGGECLICQLHQHLFISLFNAPPEIAPPPAQLVRLTAAQVSYLSHTDTPRRGRAPPASLI